MVAVDFDQTICDTQWLLGPTVPGARYWIKVWRTTGAYVYLHSMRWGPTLWLAKHWCYHNEIPLNAYHAWWWPFPSKPPYDWLVDDKNAGIALIERRGKKPIVDWEVVGPNIYEKIQGRLANLRMSQAKLKADGRSFP